MLSSDDPSVKAELEWQKSDEALELKVKLVEKNDISSIDRIDWIDKKGEHYFLKSYIGHKKVLHYLAQEIGSDAKKSKDEILELFIKCHFTGNLLEIARLVEDSFGKISFRILGSMDGDERSAVKVLIILKKMRKLITKDKPNNEEN